jgi:hypothetical protein
VKEEAHNSSDLIFDDDNTFYFPELEGETIRGQSGAYNALLDVIKVNLSTSELTATVRIGHEVAHRLLAIDSTPLRLARYIAGNLYSLIWLLLGKVAEYQADLTGIAAREIKVHNAVTPNEAMVVIEALLGRIRVLQNLLTGSLSSAQVVYELTAIELGIRLLHDRYDSSNLESIEEILLTGATKRMAKALFQAYPSYGLEKDLDLERATGIERGKALARLQRVLLDEGYYGSISQGYFLRHQSKYEQLLREMYDRYKQLLSEGWDEENLFWRVVHTNFGIGSPLHVYKNHEGKLTIGLGSSIDEMWAIGLDRPQNTPSSSLHDAWRVTQLLEMDMIKIVPEFYHTPLRMMTALDFLLFEEHGQHVGLGLAEADYGEKGQGLGNKEMVIPGPATKYYPSLLTLLVSEAVNSPEVIVNDKILNRAKDMFGLQGDWWRFLLLLEALRVTLKRGTLAYCPLRDFNIECSEHCLIRTNLDFLAGYSQMVAVPFCRE